MKIEQIQKMYDALKKISKEYQTPAQLRKGSQGEWGLDYEEALEMAYENIQLEAKEAIKGMKRPDVINAINVNKKSIK